MLFNFLFVYIEINVICFIMCAIVMSRVSSDLGNEREVTYFRVMTFVYMTMLVIDCFTQLTYRKVITVDPTLLGIAYALHMSGFGVMAFFWLRFMELQIDSRVSRSNKVIRVFMIPMILLIVLTFTSIRTGWLFRINEEGIFERGPIFSLQMFISYFYFLTAAVHAMVQASKETSPIRKKHLYTVASYVAIPSVGGILQIIFSNGVPVVAPSIAVCIFFIFINIQRRQIHHDALTGLENRKSLDIHLEDRISKVTDDNPFYLFMFDADDFKKINDVNGHPAGDTALRLIGQALKCPEITCQRFAARYGGDEFVVIVDEESGKEMTPEDFVKQVDNELERLCKASELGFTVFLSVGYAECTSKLTSAERLIEEADRMLYKNKEQKQVA